MRAICGCLMAVMVSLGPWAALADDNRPLRSARSPDGRFLLKLEPGRPLVTDARPCIGTLMAKVKPGRWEKRWSRPLVNDVAPQRVMIRADGKYAVTLDEYRRGGARNAVVVYGQQGQLLAHFGLPMLLHEDDWQHVKIRQRAVEWLEGAKARFEDEPEQFVIRLAWDREIRIDLKTLRLRETESDDSDTVADTIPEAVLALLLAEPGQTPEELGEATARSGGDGGTLDLMRAARALIVPQPDTDNPVDYLAWMTEAVRGEGNPAAPLYTAATSEMREFEGDAGLLQAAMNGDPYALQHPDIVAWLESNAGAITRFREGAGLSYAGFEYKGDAPTDMIRDLLPTLGSMRQLAKTTVTSGQHALLEGDAQTAASTFLDTAVVGSQLSSGATLIEDLTGIAMQSLAYSALADSFADPAAADLDYVKLAEEMDARDDALRPFRDAVRLEQGFALGVMQRDLPRGSFGPGAITLDDTVKEANAFYDAVAAVVDLPYPEAQPLFDELADYAADERSNALLRLLPPSFRRTFFMHTRAEMQRRGTRLLAHLKAYRQQHGSYPDTLEVFAGTDYVIDPLTEHPFIYRHEGDEVWLYSTGADGADNGGLHDERAEMPERDYVIWPRPTPE
ncbi:MAG: hypothetical protein JXO22_09755 [Phycisphaerae bacterium]|nr:hypothetical protein [Phycisphaerae bacterium]